MPQKIIIYGKDTWHYTTSARNDYASRGYDVDYRRVDMNRDDLEEMLKLSHNQRQVPVIQDGDKVVIGFGGTWGVWIRLGTGYEIYKGVGNSNALSLL